MLDEQTCFVGDHLRSRQPLIFFSPSSSLSSLELSDPKLYEPSIRARLGTTAHFYEVVVLKPTATDQPPVASHKGPSEEFWYKSYPWLWIWTAISHRYPGGKKTSGCYATLETTQGRMDGFFSHFPYKRHLFDVAFVGD